MRGDRFFLFLFIKYEKNYFLIVIQYYANDLKYNLVIYKR